MGLLNKVFSIGKRQPEQYICIEDRKYIGTHGGTFTSGAWRQRDLNTIVQDDTGQALVSGNVVYLPPGNYRCQAHVPASVVDSHVARLIDEASGDALLTGTIQFSFATIGATKSLTASYIAGKFRLTTNGSVRVEHLCGVTRSDFGFGIASNLTCETYTRMELFRTTL